MIIRGSHGKNSQQRRAIKQNKKNQSIREDVAKKNKKMYMKPEIFFDESGNTGGDLLDLAQFVFTLGACDISKSDAIKALELTESKSPNEAHFKTLRRRKSGQDGIIRLLESKYINEDTVKVFIIDKRYMLTTKVVDILIETWSYNRGIDIYLNGQNLALSNYLYYCLRVFCGQEPTDKMYDRFIKMIKNQDAESIEQFYISVDELKACASSDNFISTLDRISITKSDITNILNDTEMYILDPAIPSLFKHCIEWDKIYPNGYHIKHDDSKAISERKGIFDLFMDWTKESEEFGYDRRKFELPLKARSLTFHSSAEYPQLQVADIVSSAAAYYGNCLKKKSDEYLFQELQTIKIDKYFNDMLVGPSTAVTPEELRTVHKGGVNPANGVAKDLTES
ncbi:MAG: DUF3800 domain-containing protein [Leclercia sp.]